jgi:hypothetical protein
MRVNSRSSARYIRRFMTHSFPLRSHTIVAQRWRSNAGQAVACQSINHVNPTIVRVLISPPIVSAD